MKGFSALVILAIVGFCLLYAAPAKACDNRLTLVTSGYNASYNAAPAKTGYNSKAVLLLASPQAQAVEAKVTLPLNVTTAPQVLLVDPPPATLLVTPQVNYNYGNYGSHNHNGNVAVFLPVVFHGHHHGRH